MWELDHKEGSVLKDDAFKPVVLEKTLDCQEIKPVNPKGNQLWIFTGRTDAEAEAPVLWSPDAKNWLPGKDPDAGKDWGQEEKGVTEDGMVGWHHWFNGHEFEQTLGNCEWQGSLVCCSPWVCKESDMTEWLNNKWQLYLKSCFYWSVVDLQHCVSFRYIAEWFSYTHLFIFQIIFHYMLLWEFEYSSLWFSC